jgi:protein-disulfide isomerase
MFFGKKEECNTWTNNNLLIWVIVVMALVISVMGFFLWKMTAGGTGETKVKYDSLSIKVITDSRDSSTDASVIIDEMKLLPSISGAKFEVQDFADKWVKEYLLENEIKALPAFVFSTNNFDVSMDPVQAGQPKINSFLTKLKSGEFFLEIGATYDPFVERSERWFRMVTKEQLETLKKDIYVKWDENAKIMWFEYSELECPYCARHFKSNTSKEVLEKYPNDINLVFQHYPLPFHNNAELAAQTLECMWAQKGTKGFYDLIEKSFTDAELKADGNISTTLTSSRTYLVEQAVAFGADKAKMEKCIDDKVFATKVSTQMKNATDFFGVTWTPGNVLINTETLEFEVVSWAFPASSFIDLVERLK